jgi:hypothetical protein
VRGLVPATLLAAGTAGWACASGAPRPGAEEAAAIVIDAEHALVKTGPVGATDARPATYALVDAKNRSAQDRMVTVEGQLLPGDGAGSLGRVTGNELRIPAGATRTFALVGDGAVPDARKVSVRLVRAPAVTWAPQVEISEDQLARVQEYSVVTAVAKNVIDKEETATVAATFYDPGGRILARPATIVGLPVGASRTLRLEGPREAVRATVFVAEVVFSPL